MVAIAKFVLVGAIVKEYDEIEPDISLLLRFVVQNFSTRELHAYTGHDYLGGTDVARELMNDPEYKSVTDLGIEWDVFVDPSTRRVLQDRKHIYLGDFRIKRKMFCCFKR